MFGAAGREHMRTYGSTPEHFAKIGYKNHKHSVNNPYAQFQDAYTPEDILAAKMISDPLTKLQCLPPTSDGSGAVVLASEAFIDQHDLAPQAVEIVGQAMTTDFASTFDGSAASLIGHDMNVQAGQKVYEQLAWAAGLPGHRTARLLLGQRAAAVRGAGAVRTRRGAAADRRRRHHLRRALGGQPLRRVDLKGHPLGATGLAQCSELTWQLRGTAAERQVDNVTAALQHNIGLVARPW